MGVGIDFWILVGFVVILAIGVILNLGKEN